MRDIAFQQSIYHASADFAHRRMTHRAPAFAKPATAGEGRLAKVGMFLGDHGQARGTPFEVTFFFWAGISHAGFMSYPDDT